MIDMFVQRSEDYRDTTVEVVSEAVPRGDGGPDQRGDTTNEETVTETRLMSSGCAANVAELRSDRNDLFWTNRCPLKDHDRIPLTRRTNTKKCLKMSRNIWSLCITLQS